MQICVQQKTLFLVFKVEFVASFQLFGIYPTPAHVYHTALNFVKCGRNGTHHSCFEVFAHGSLGKQAILR